MTDAQTRLWRIEYDLNRLHETLCGIDPDPIDCLTNVVSILRALHAEIEEMRRVYDSA